MTFRHLLLGAGRLIYDLIRLFLPNTIFVHGFIHRERLGYDNFNWGDDINIRMIEDISNLKVLIVNASHIYPRIARKVYCCIGSVLGHCNVGKISVWGTGFISEDDQMWRLPERVYSVRGPLTRKKLLEQGIDCPAVYGDPALLVSKYYHPKVEKRYKYGIIPHYSDESNAIIKAMSKRPDVLVISMQTYCHWHDIPDAVCSCEMIVSSSLHGIIVSDSYGIPNVWARFSDRLYGGNFKFLDYLESVDRDLREPIVIKGSSDLDAVLNDVSLFTVANNIDFDVIYEACPFKEHLRRFQ